MGPKTEKRKSTQEEAPISLSDPVNTDEWKCAVVLVIEGTERDGALTHRFAEEASMEARKQVKSIDFECDVIKIVKNFITGEIGHRFNFLLNFSAIFEEAAEYVKNVESIPVSLMVKIIKSLVLLLRKEDELERKGRMLSRDNPIEIMAEKPLIPLYGNETIENDDGKGRSGRRKSVKNGMTAVRIKPLTPAKEDTKLLRRGEQVRDLNIIDDVPDNSFFQLCIALTGFREPELALEMLKDGIPLHGVICLHSACAVKPMSSSLSVNLDAFWNDFLQLLWNPNLTYYFRDVVFLVYSPSELPTDEKELRSFIYREVSFLMYDLSDLKHQHRHYLRHMRLWNVDEHYEKVELDTAELDRLPQDCMSIPLIIQNMMDALCGEDDQDDQSELSASSTSRNTSMFSMSTTRLAFPHESRTSFTSLVPLTSTVKLPTPRWSTIIDTDEKLLLYSKMLALDQLYELEDNSERSVLETNSLAMNVCSVKKRRLNCENLDLEIESLSEGLLVKLWRNYPVQEKGDANVLNEITGKLNYPELTVNYILYIIWIIRMEEATKENYDLSSIAERASDISQTRFTVTDGSRIALQKTNRSPNFFSPSQLKIIPPEMLTSFSAPQFRTPPKFSWTDKSFVSDIHIPVKYLQGAPMSVFDDLRNYLGEEAFSRMKDYDFIEELNKRDMIQRIQDTVSNYDGMRHAYLPLTDCIYVVMYDNPTVNGVQRQLYNVMLRTPVGLRDFYNYILDDEREWLKEQNLGAEDGKTREGCPDSMYKPTPDFRGFTEYDFWHENSIKCMNHEGEVIESVMQKIVSGERASVRKRTIEERHTSGQKSWSSVYAEPGEPYKFVGFDFEPGAVQYSGVDTTFKGPDNCSLRVSLQERLYGTQQLGVHVQQGGHNLHLYSYVCPQPHLHEPYTCHVEYNNGTILAFSRRVFPSEGVPPEDDSIAMPEMLEDQKFAYDMKLSFPHGLTVTIIREHVNPCYIKQCYRENSSGAAMNEKSRLYLPDGSVVRMMTDDVVQVLKSDTSIVTASLHDLVSTFLQSDSEFSSENAGESSVSSTQRLHFRSYRNTSQDGSQITVVNGEVTETNHYQIITKTEKETQRTYYRRMDGTCYVMMDNGSICVEFPDGSKICTYLREEELYLEEETAWDGEDAAGSIYTVIHMKIVMEHPHYATAVYDTRNSTWRLILPCRSDIEVDSQGCYQVHLDGQTELDINTKAIRMWRYNPRDEFIISTVADLTIFGNNPSTDYCVTADCRGRRFSIEPNGTCYVTENVWDECGSCSTFEHQSEDTTEPKRYFVVRRDLSGFEIIHTRNVKKDIENIESHMTVHSQELKTTPATRYFAILKEVQADANNKWMVESITPKTKFSVPKRTTSSTYGKPPSWMHPFPKNKTKAHNPGVLHGRILLETKPTECPTPEMSNASLLFCDTSHFPEAGLSLSDDVTNIMRRVASQDQKILKEIYYESMRKRAEANKVHHTAGPEIENYLKLSEYHVKHREYLKNCIHQRKVPRYFDYPPGIVWQIIQTVIDSIITKKREHKPEFPAVSDGCSTSKESSEVEYNLEWSTEPSFSDLSNRSNLSTKTAPDMSRPPMSQSLLPEPRDTKSEPIYKIKDRPNPNDDLSYVPGYSFTPPSSDVCGFTVEDILTLEKKSSSKENEPEWGMYELQDLMDLGLV